jgi:hypothetical protein
MSAHKPTLCNRKPVSAHKPIAERAVVQIITGFVA